MRFMMIVKSTPASESGVMPSSGELAAMGRYNEELIKAGVLLAAEGLKSSAEGARVRYGRNGQTVVDGPFAEARELIAGFWIIDVKDRDEALAWARRVPFSEGEEVEVRKVFEAADFPADPVSEEYLKKEQAWRDENQKPITSL